MGAVAMTAAHQLLIAAPWWRALRWQPMVASWVLSAALLGWRVNHVHNAAAAVTLLRVVAVLLTLGALFVLDDEAHSIAAAAAVSLAVRTTARVAVAAVGCAAAWIPALALTEARTGVRVPAAISVEIAALLVCGLAVAAVAQRFFDLPEPGLAAGPAAVGLILGLLLLPEQFAFVTPPGDGWPAAHVRWAGLLAIGALAVVASMRDPASRPLRARFLRAVASDGGCRVVAARS
jgi:hypothetical protein